MTEKSDQGITDIHLCNRRVSLTIAVRRQDELPGCVRVVRMWVLVGVLWLQVTYDGIAVEDSRQRARIAAIHTAALVDVHRVRIKRMHAVLRCGAVWDERAMVPIRPRWLSWHITLSLSILVAHIGHLDFIPFDLLVDRVVLRHAKTAPGSLHASVVDLCVGVVPGRVGTQRAAILLSVGVLSQRKMLRVGQRVGATGVFSRPLRNTTCYHMVVVLGDVRLSAIVFEVVKSSIGQYHVRSRWVLLLRPTMAGVTAVRLKRNVLWK